MSSFSFCTLRLGDCSFKTRSINYFPVLIFTTSIKELLNDQPHSGREKLNRCVWTTLNEVDLNDFQERPPSSLSHDGQTPTSERGAGGGGTWSDLIHLPPHPTPPSPPLHGYRGQPNYFHLIHKALYQQWLKIPGLGPLELKRSPPACAPLALGSGPKINTWINTFSLLHFPQFPFKGPSVASAWIKRHIALALLIPITGCFTVSYQDRFCFCGEGGGGGGGGGGDFAHAVCDIYLMSPKLSPGWNDLSLLMLHAGQHFEFTWLLYANSIQMSFLFVFFFFFFFF